MPQATSAQREPSMEEILASIRRIIEDSDSSKKHPSDGEIEAQAKPAAAEPVAKAEVEAFRAELRTPPAPREAAVERRPASLSEIQADLRKALVEPAHAAPAAVAAVKPSTMAEIQAALVKEPEVKEPAIKDVVAEVAPAVSPATPETKPFVSMADIQALLNKDAPPPRPLPSPIAPMVEVAPATYEPKPFVAPVQIDAVQPVAVAAPAPTPVSTYAATPKAVQPETPKSSIISQSAGRQVAAAFGELSEVFAASRQKSFDEMAEQMMRPMLQEWMDNNLPVLVERLVREEIERVARGV